MKHFFVALLLIWPLAASGVNLNMDRVNVVELVNLIYGDILKRNFALHSAVLKKEDVVTVHFQKDMSTEKIEQYAENLLESMGVVVEKKPGYVFIRPLEKAKDHVKPENEVFFYRPKYRSVEYLKDVVSGLFGRLSPSVNSTVSPTIIPIDQDNESAPRSASRHQLQQLQQRQQTQQSFIGGNRNNSRVEHDVFVWHGTEKDIAKLEKLLALVDTPAGELLVKGFVYEVTSKQGEGTAIGLAVNLLNNRVGFNIGNASRNLGNAITLNSSGSLGVEAVFSALATDSRFKVISSPSLRVKSGETARFSAGSDVPVLGSVQLDRNGNAIQSVEYKPSGVIFDLKGHVRENVIDLNVRQQLSSFTITTTGVNASPTLLKREISTGISAQPDEVIILGGLDETKASQDRSGLTFLPEWLHSRGGEDSKTEILLVLQVQKL